MGEMNRCLWCDGPTKDGICGPNGERMPLENFEPWHRACFAERQAWDMAVGAGACLGQGDDESARTCAAAGRLWLEIARHLGAPPPYMLLDPDEPDEP
jgi:hypothetical protein